jgi:hypothetical protein
MKARVGLPVAFIAITALWFRVEDRSRGLDPMVRVGRSAIGLLAVLIGLPVVVLMPLFWLESQLPLEAVPADLTVPDRPCRGRQRPPLGNAAPLHDATRRRPSSRLVGCDPRGAAVTSLVSAAVFGDDDAVCPRGGP